MSRLLTKLLSISSHYPLVRGMISYAIIWPSCSIVQEYLEHGTTLKDANWPRAARFGFFGSFFMAPVFYGWMKYSSRFFKGKDLFTSMTRAAIEQVSYSPLAMAYFFFGMSILEGKQLKVSVNEVREKFWPTYKIGVLFWPTAQTINFYFVSEKNRIIFVSVASFVWTVYLAHMKGKKQSLRISESQPILIAPVTESLDNVIENKMDKKPLIMVEINPGIAEQKPIIELESDIGDGKKKPPLVVEPQLIADIRPKNDINTQKITESQSTPIEKKQAIETKVKSSSESAVNKKSN